MLADLIHKLFDGSLGRKDKDELLSTLWSSSAAMNEYCQQQRIHDAVAMDKSAILSAASPDDDLAAIFARVQQPQEKRAVLPIPVLPTADAHAPEIGSGQASVEGLQKSSFMPPLADDEAAKPNKRRRPIPIIGRMALQALSFCVVGAGAATFGVMPLGKGSAPSFFAQNDGIARQNVETPQNQFPSAASEHSTLSSFGVTVKLTPHIPAAMPSSIANGFHSSFAFADTLESEQGKEIVSYLPKNTRKEINEHQPSEALQMCVFKGIKRIGGYPEEPTMPDAVQTLATTTLPSPKRLLPPKEAHKPFLALTARTSMNIDPSGYGVSVGAMYALSERDAIGIEIGGAFGRKGLKARSSEGVQSLDAAGFLANVYRFTLPVAGTRLSVFSQIRVGIESTGTIFGGVGIGAQYQVTDNLFLVASAEGARALWQSPSSDQAFKLAHDGVSLGVAVKL